MANTGILQEVMGIFPYIEIIVRRLYRSKLFKFVRKRQARKRTKSSVPVTQKYSFDEVISSLRSFGLQKGDVVIVHSAYRPLKRFGLSPKEIVDHLIDFVGENGTLAMPVIRKYPESPTEEEALTKDISNIEFHYDPKESKVWTGVIPKTLMKTKGSVTSLFPLNSMTAVGKDASYIMNDNLKGNLPTANGRNSSWKRCTDLNAWVISLGTDLTHSLTMIHTAEDVLREKWPIKGWYRKKHFVIDIGSSKTKKTVLERHPKWGMLHFGERKLSHDLLHSGVMKSITISDGVVIEALKSKELFDFLNARNKYGYPYFGVKAFLKNN